jgi:hypothetical protein
MLWAKPRLPLVHLAGAAYLGGKYFSGEEGGSFGKLSLDDEPEVPVTGHPVGANPMSTLVQTSGDITPPTTSDRFGQDVVENQTYEVQQAKGLSQAKPTTVQSKPSLQLKAKSLAPNNISVQVAKKKCLGKVRQKERLLQKKQSLCRHAETVSRT